MKINSIGNTNFGLKFSKEVNELFRKSCDAVNETQPVKDDPLTKFVLNNKRAKSYLRKFNSCQEVYNCCKSMIEKSMGDEFVLEAEKFNSKSGMTLYNFYIYDTVNKQRELRYKYVPYEDILEGKVWEELANTL